MGRLPEASAKAPAASRAAPAASAPPAQGLGMTSARLRERMVSRLMDNGVRDANVLAAMRRVARHDFVDEGLASRAYEDSALPIGFEQTISQPLVVGLMTQMLLDGGKPARVLEVGTGCGYQAAILACCCGEVFSVERIRALHERARQNLRPLRLANLRLVFGDGLAGIADSAPFDGMLIAAGAADLPQSLLDQLAIGGRAIAPLGAADRQSLCIIRRETAGSFRRTVHDAVRFVPLLPGVS